jgi:uracil-DNA glycosylase
MNWINFKDQFHESYHQKIKPFIESQECDLIYEHLKQRSRKGHKIAPSSSLTYRCFRETPLDEIKVVMMGMAPYHTVKHGEYVADGLLMGCSVTDYLQPSLEQFYTGIENELYDGLTLNHWKNPDVLHLAKQGVFMYNASLTTEVNKPGSHLEVWHPFTKYVFENIIGYLGVPIIFLGKDAAKFEKYLPPFTWTFTLSHPAAAAYKGTQWSSEGVFTKVNKILKDNNNFEIKWLQENE